MGLIDHEDDFLFLRTSVGDSPACDALLGAAVVSDGVKSETTKVPLVEFRNFFDCFFPDTRALAARTAPDGSAAERCFRLDFFVTRTDDESPFFSTTTACADRVDEMFTLVLRAPSVFDADFTAVVRTSGSWTGSTAV